MVNPNKEAPATLESQRDQGSRQKLKQARRALKSGGSRAGEVKVLAPDEPIERLLATQQARQQAVDTLMECLKAERTYYDLFSKSMVTEPDYATRCSAAKTLLAYDVGEPVKRQQIIVSTVESADEIRKKLESSPAAREEMRKLLEEAQAKTGRNPA